MQLSPFRRWLTWSVPESNNWVWGDLYMKILLVCAAGMSTSLLVTKMQKAAAARGLTVEIVAHASPDFDQVYKEFDAILLGPQVRFRQQDWAPVAAAAGIPLGVINTVDYGMMNGEKVLDQALAMVKSKSNA